MGGGSSTEVYHHHHYYQDPAVLQQLDAARQKLVALEVEMAQHANPATFAAKHKEVLGEFMEHVKRLPEGEKVNQRNNIAIIGQRGVGKSSIVNMLARRKVAETGDVDTTQKIAKAFESDLWDLWDVPGTHDNRIYFNLQHIMQMKSMACIMVVYVDGIQLVLNLIRLVTACGLPLVVVRNKAEAVDTATVLDQERATLRAELGKEYPLLHVSTLTGKNLIMLEHALVQVPEARKAKRALDDLGLFEAEKDWLASEALPAGASRQGPLSERARDGVRQLVDMGYSRKDAEAAMKVAGPCVNGALDYLAAR